MEKQTAKPTVLPPKVLPLSLETDGYHRLAWLRSLYIVFIECLRAGCWYVYVMTLTQRGLHKAHRGFVQIYSHTYAQGCRTRFWYSL